MLDLAVFASRASGMAACLYASTDLARCGDDYFARRINAFQVLTDKYYYFFAGSAPGVSSDFY